MSANDERAGGSVLHARLFDGLSVEHEGMALSRFRSERAGALFAYLAYRPGRAYRRDALVELLWPDATLDSGRANLSTTLWTLRQLLSELRVQGELLLAGRTTVCLEGTRVQTDVATFEQALSVAERLDEGEPRLQLLEVAAQQYQGDLLRGYHDTWVFPERTRLQQRFQQLLRELVRSCETLGDRTGAVRYASRAVQEDPLCEAACLQLMRVTADAGHPAVALEHYRNLERQLQQELDCSPSEALRAFAREIGRRQRAPLERRITLAPSAVAHQPSTDSEPPVSPAPSTSGRTAEGGATPALESVGGAVALDSELYLVRASDQEFRRAIARGDSVVLVKGPRQTGKSSLLARGAQEARTAGAGVVWTDLQAFTTAQLQSAETVFLALAGSVADQLPVETAPRDSWDPDLGAGLNLRRYLRKEVLGQCPGRLVWTIDEIDRLFPFEYADEVFGLFRSWHNERALDPGGPWTRLTLSMGYATEAHLFITDLNQSPFNVGTRLELEDFTPAQVAELDLRHGAPLGTPERRARFWQLVGGHPYLVRRGLHELVRRDADLGAFEAQAGRDAGVYAGHLQRLVLSLSRDEELREVVAALLRGTPCPSPTSFYRLRSAGVISGESAPAAQFRCRLYEEHLRRHLGQ